MHAKRSPQYPVTRIKAGRCKDIPLNVKEFNINELDDIIWIELDADLVRHAYLYEVRDVTTEESKVIQPDLFVQDHVKWIRVSKLDIDTSVGYHTYKLSFVDRHSNARFGLYIAYIIQNDNPDKPYIYMKRSKVEDDDVEQDNVPSENNEDTSESSNTLQTDNSSEDNGNEVVE